MGGARCLRSHSVKRLIFKAGCFDTNHTRRGGARFACKHLQEPGQQPKRSPGFEIGGRSRGGEPGSLHIQPPFKYLAGWLIPVVAAGRAARQPPLPAYVTLLLLHDHANGAGAKQSRDWFKLQTLVDRR